MSPHNLVGIRAAIHHRREQLDIATGLFGYAASAATMLYFVGRCAVAWWHG